jgi:hypothetical protein
MRHCQSIKLESEFDNIVEDSRFLGCPLLFWGESPEHEGRAYNYFWYNY